MSAPRILLVHLVSNGDCLLATTVARQIKADFPGCHLTWAIGYKCRHVIDNNPDVDDVWSVEYSPSESLHEEVWVRTKAEAERRRREGEFAHVFYTQSFPDNINNFDGTTRSSLFRAYPRRITVPVQPVVRLREQEEARVARFVEEKGLARFANVVLFESSPSSKQSSMTQELALAVAHRIVRERSDTAFVISSHHAFQSSVAGVVDGSPLSYRENAALARSCTLLLGCSSGITWLTTSTAGKRLPTIQFLQSTDTWYTFASVKYDHQHFGLGTDHILETDISTEEQITGAVSRYLAQGGFEGLPRREFAPNIRQLHDLYKMSRGRMDVRRVRRNFAARNGLSNRDEAAFWLGLARIEARRYAGTVARRGATAVRRAMGTERSNA
jgi:hypothetical protein